MPLTVSAAAAWPKLCATLMPEVPVGLRVRLRVDLGQQHRGVDVLVLVGEPQVADDVGPVVGQRVEHLLEVVGERHGAQPSSAAASATRIRRASSAPSACALPSTSTIDRAAERLARRDRELAYRAGSRARRGSAASPGRESETRAKVPASPGSSSASATPSSSSAMLELAVGIGSPCGSWLGSPSCCGDPLLEVLGDVVLEHLGLVVDPVPGHPERLGEIGLDQAVVADHLERDPLARRRSARRRGRARTRRARSRPSASASRSPSRARRRADPRAPRSRPGPPARRASA